jgi:hypothetical protein
MNNSNAKSALVLAVAMVAVLFVACTKNENVFGHDQIVGSGRLVSQTRTVGTFSGIQVTNFAKVFVTQDEDESLRIESDDNVIDLVMTSVSNGTLVVGLRDGSYNNVTVNVYASMKTIKRLGSAGAADFFSTNSIHADSIVCRIEGAGSITLAGDANYELVEIVGAGDVHNFNLVSSSCYASISGTGNIEVNVSQQLDAVIAGSGVITYAGNPSVVRQTITGVGSLRRKP